MDQVVEKSEKTKMSKKIVLPKNKVRVCVTVDPMIAYRLKRFCVDNSHSVSGYVEAVLRFDLDNREGTNYEADVSE